MTLNQGLYLAPYSNSKKLGIFASKPIKKGDLILTFEGFEMRGIEYDEYWLGEETWVQIGDRRWLDARRYGKFLNHSCSPNSAVFNLVNLRALKDIRPSEEIHMDFETSDWDDSTYGSFVCKCGYGSCRGIIQGYRFLTDNLRGMYKEMGIIPDFLLELENR